MSVDDIAAVLAVHGSERVVPVARDGLWRSWRAECGCGHVLAEFERATAGAEVHEIVRLHRAHVAAAIIEILGAPTCESHPCNSYCR